MWFSILNLLKGEIEYIITMSQTIAKCFSKKKTKIDKKTELTLEK